MTLLRAHAVSQHYARAAKPTLVEVTFDVAAEEFVAIVGPSGAGKTTLLQVLAGLLPHDGGTIEIDGQRPWDHGERAAAQFRRRHLGLLPQGAPLLHELDVGDNTALPLLLDRADNARQRAGTALAALGIEQLAGRRPDQLSGGEALRVALARAMVATPSLLLADEPTSHLDPDNANLVIEELARARSRGCAVIAVTHDPRVTDAADRRLRLHEGRIA